MALHAVSPLNALKGIQLYLFVLGGVCHEHTHIASLPEDTYRARWHNGARRLQWGKTPTMEQDAYNGARQVTGLLPGCCCLTEQGANYQSTITLALRT